MLANKELREEKGDIPFWVIADHLGVHEVTLMRWFRTEMKNERKEKILNAIKEIKSTYKST